MAEREPKWPEAGDPVIATVEAVTNYGAYAKLDGKCELLHIACIAKSAGQGNF
jgi:translation initiation factor 2 alpha subunit (eIF-2alpha)